MDDCVFCGIVGKTVPAEILFEDDRVVAFADTNPQSPVHLLVIPKQHLESVDRLADDQAELLGRTLLAAAAVGKKETDGNFRVELNAGNRIEIDHLHVHVQGERKGGDST